MQCASAFPAARNADFRPRKPRFEQLSVPVGLDPEAELSTIKLEAPDVTYAGPRGIRDGRELLSVLQQSLGSPGTVLDLGCGPRDQADPVLSLGHRYVGIDYSNPNADLLADAHSLPFRSGSFDFVLSFAVLEHLHNPFLALNEIRRVLKPGGIMCGTVSLGEPFHGSFLHHSAWGVVSVCRANHFEIMRLWPTQDTLKALSTMGRYPRVIRVLLKMLDRIHSGMPFLAPRKMRWPQREKYIDRLHRAASIGFVIRRPTEP